MRYAFIRDRGLPYPLARQCQVLEVSMSGFCAWRKRGETAKQREDARLLGYSREVHAKSRATYGPRRLLEVPTTIKLKTLPPSKPLMIV